MSGVGRLQITPPFNKYIILSSSLHYNLTTTQYLEGLIQQEGRMVKRLNHKKWSIWTNQSWYIPKLHFFSPFAPCGLLLSVQWSFACQPSGRTKYHTTSHVSYLIKSRPPLYVSLATFWYLFCLEIPSSSWVEVSLSTGMLQYLPNEGIPLFGSLWRPVPFYVQRSNLGFDMPQVWLLNK